MIIKNGVVVDSFFIEVSSLYRIFGRIVQYIGLNKDIYLFFRYFQQTEKVPLMQYLCEERVLKNDPRQTKCLHEQLLDGDNKSRDEL